jgi:hypothetical protein
VRKNTVERRTELLKLEGLGFSESEIVTELSQKYHVDPRSIYRDFESRDKWQLTKDAHKLFLKAFNRLEQSYKRAAAIYLMNSQNPNAQLGAARIMTDIAIRQIELTGYKIPPMPDGDITLSWSDNTVKTLKDLDQYNQALKHAAELNNGALLRVDVSKLTEHERQTIDEAASILLKHQQEDKVESIH